jgi:hypothetical protein
MTKELTNKDLFVPVVSKDLRKTYPELAKIEEFKDMNSLDLKFCWYYAIYFSDIVDVKEKVRKSIDHSYGDVISRIDKDRFMRLDFPDRIIVAVKKFETFDIGVRFQARMITERQLQAFEKLSIADVDNVGKILIYDEDDKNHEDPIGEKRDWTQVNAFVNTQVKINESLPELINRLEEGFGIKTSKSVKTISGGDIREDYFRKKEEQELEKN